MIDEELRRITAAISERENIEAEQIMRSPEVTLWLNVLLRALQDAIVLSSMAHENASARRWFRSDSIEPLSFRWVCEVLGLTDYRWLRRYVFGWDVTRYHPERSVLKGVGKTKSAVIKYRSRKMAQAVAARAGAK